MARMYAADRDRERAAAALREHYARGRLTLEELSSRVGRVLTARSRRELRRELSGLPMLFDGGELAVQGRSMARSAVRGAMLVVFTAAYFVFSFTLLLVLGVTLLIAGASGAVLVAFLLVWLVPTYLLTRLWRHRPHRATST
jgi:Flp pilus assembly protein TadB